MAKVIISLLGGRPLPNILQVIHLEPDFLYFIVSEDSVGEGKNSAKAISALPDHLKLSDLYPVKPYERTETFQTCEIIARKHKDDQVIISFASEPKIMTLGAYDCAAKLRAEGQKIDICYLAREGLIWVSKDTDDIEPVQITLPKYFASYGWNIRMNTTETSEKYQQLVSLLVENLPFSHNLLYKLRSEDNGEGNKGKRTKKCKKTLIDEEFSILQKIEKLGVLHNVQQINTETKFTIPGDEEAKFLLTGDWLEYYVFQEALKLTKSKGVPLFDECGWGVEDVSGKGEIDFAGIFGGQMIIASCKTGDNVNRSYFEEIHSKSEQLGKGMCSILVVSSVSRETRTEKKLQDYEKWAREREIGLVMAEDIPQISKVLHKFVQGNNNEKPEHIPYYDRI